MFDYKRLCLFKHIIVQTCEIMRNQMLHNTKSPAIIINETKYIYINIWKHAHDIVLRTQTYTHTYLKNQLQHIEMKTSTYEQI